MATLDKLTTILDFKTDLTSLRQAEAATNRARGRLDDLTTSATRTRGSIGNIGAAFRGLGPILATVGAGLVAHRLKEYADTWTLVGNRVALYTSSVQESQKVQQRLFQISQDTRSSLEATATLYQRVAMSNDQLGVSQDRLLGFTETLNKAFIVSGASAAEARNALIQMSQGLASGQLRGEEYRSVMEQGTRVIQALATQLGVSRGELMKMAHTGQLTSDVVFKAIEADAANINAEFEKLTPTIGQAFTVLNNSLTGAVGQFSEATGAANFFAEAITGIAGAIDSVTQSGRRQDDQLTAAQRRRQARQRQTDAGVPSIGAGRGTPPPGLNAAQRRQWRRGRFNLQPSGFAAAIGAGFDSSGAGLPTPFQLPAARPEDATLANINRQFDAYFDRLFGLQGRQGPALNIRGGRGGLAGLEEAFKKLPVGKVAADTGRLSKRFELIRADIMGFDVAMSDGGLAVGLVNTKTQRWSQGLADLSQVLINSASGTSRFAGAVLSIVQGAATGGPLGAIAAGIGTLGGILFQGAKASREAARAERERIFALREATFDAAAESTAEARRRADPLGQAAAEAAIFGQLAGFLQGITPSALAGDRPNFGTGGRVSQFFGALGSLDLLRSGNISREQLGSLGSQIETLTAGFEQTFGNISLAELGRKFIDSSAFAALFGGGNLANPLPVGPASTPIPQAAQEAIAAAGLGPPIQVSIERIVIEVDGAGSPDEVADAVERRLAQEYRNVVESVDTQIKA